MERAHVGLTYVVYMCVCEVSLGGEHRKVYPCNEVDQTLEDSLILGLELRS